MFLKLFILFTSIPLLEIWLLIKIGQHIGALNTIAIVVLTGILGAWLARSQGLQLFQRIRADLQQGRLPADSLVDGVLILVGGILLLTPGLITDTIGFLLLLPPSRSLLKKYLKERFRIYINRGTYRTHMDFYNDNDHIDDI